MTENRRAKRPDRGDPYERILSPSSRLVKRGVVWIGLLLAGSIAFGSAYAIVSTSLMFAIGLWALWQGRA